jgi:hypothetical protein
LKNTFDGIAIFCVVPLWIVYPWRCEIGGNN